MNLLSYSLGVTHTHTNGTNRTYRTKRFFENEKLSLHDFHNALSFVYKSENFESAGSGNDPVADLDIFMLEHGRGAQ